MPCQAWVSISNFHFLSYHPAPGNYKRWPTYLCWVSDRHTNRTNWVRWNRDYGKVSSFWTAVPTVWSLRQYRNRACSQAMMHSDNIVCFHLQRKTRPQFVCVAGVLLYILSVPTMQSQLRSQRWKRQTEGWPWNIEKDSFCLLHFPWFSLGAKEVHWDASRDEGSNTMTSLQSSSSQMFLFWQCFAGFLTANKELLDTCKSTRNQDFLNVITASQPPPLYSYEEDSHVKQGTLLWNDLPKSHALYAFEWQDWFSLTSGWS